MSKNYEKKSNLVLKDKRFHHNEKLAIDRKSEMGLEMNMV